jgi:hypothetical protein
VERSMEMIIKSIVYAVGTIFLIVYLGNRYGTLRLRRSWEERGEVYQLMVKLPFLTTPLLFAVVGALVLYANCSMLYLSIAVGFVYAVAAYFFGLFSLIMTEGRFIEEINERYG